MRTRSSTNFIVPRVYTKSVDSLCFAKCKDSDHAVGKLIEDAETALHRDKKGVIISLVIPDSRYKNKSKYIHQGHTFAITRNAKYLLLYDIRYDTAYKSTQKHFKNYQLVINALKQDRTILFYPSEYYAKVSEGICFEYIQHLEQNNLIL